MNAPFVILRILAAFSSLASLALICVVVFLRDAASTAKQGAEVFGYVARLFGSGFTQGTAPTSEAWRIGPWQIIIAALSLMMLVSVFTPRFPWFLHAVGLLAAVVMIGYLRMILTGPSMEIICLPSLVVWLGYYAMFVFWFRASAIR